MRGGRAERPTAFTPQLPERLLFVSTGPAWRRDMSTHDDYQGLRARPSGLIAAMRRCRRPSAHHCTGDRGTDWTSRPALLEAVDADGQGSLVRTRCCLPTSVAAQHHSEYGDLSTGNAAYSMAAYSLSSTIAKFGPAARVNSGRVDGYFIRLVSRGGLVGLCGSYSRHPRVRGL